MKPTAETWGNRAVMRDGYQRHPATHMGVHSNPHTPVHMGHKDTHDYTHRYTGQKWASVQTHTHQATLTSNDTRPTYDTPVVHMPARLCFNTH